MYISAIYVSSPFNYLWLKSVNDVDLSQHCAKCLIGDYDTRLNRNTTEAHNITLKDSIYYLCGVARPYNWANNFHLAFRPLSGGIVDYSDKGIHVVISDAEQLPIDPVYINQDDPHAKHKTFNTCRNWQFAHWFKTHKQP